MTDLTRQADILAAAQRRVDNQRTAFRLLHDAMRNAGMTVALTPEGTRIGLKCAKCPRTDDLRKAPTCENEHRFLCPECRKVEERLDDCASEHVHDRRVERIMRECGE